MLYKSREQAYDAYRESPDRFFERYHQRWFNEKDLISPEWSWYETRYHYNLVENSIIDILRSNFSDITCKHVLDVGCGTGHWVEFYQQCLEACHITGVDFSNYCVEHLAHRYADINEIEIQHQDISVLNSTFNHRFDVINAIGVLFHLVDDDQWEAAVSNLLAYLSDDGIIIVGGEFADSTREMGVMRKHRALQYWKECLDRAGGQVMDVRYHEWFRGGVNEGLKNNLLVITKA